MKKRIFFLVCVISFFSCSALLSPLGLFAEPAENDRRIALVI